MHVGYVRSNIGGASHVRGPAERWARLASDTRDVLAKRKRGDGATTVYVCVCVGRDPHTARFISTRSVRANPRCMVWRWRVRRRLPVCHMAVRGGVCGPDGLALGARCRCATADK